MDKYKSTISQVNSVRFRPNMYVGRIGDGNYMDDGIYVTLREIIEWCIKSLIGCEYRNLNIDIDYYANLVTVSFYGLVTSVERIKEIS